MDNEKGHSLRFIVGVVIIPLVLLLGVIYGFAKLSEYLNRVGN